MDWLTSGSAELTQDGPVGLEILLEKREVWMQIRGSYMAEAAAVSLRIHSEGQIGTNDLKELLIQMGCVRDSEQNMFGLPEETD